MTHTAANVPVNGTAYRINGADKQTVTDVTVASNSETVTATELGLNMIYSAFGHVFTGQATDTGTAVKCTVSAAGDSITLAEFVAAGTAATTAASTVIRVWATGY